MVARVPAIPPAAAAAPARGVGPVGASPLGRALMRGIKAGRIPI